LPRAMTSWIRAFLAAFFSPQPSFGLISDTP
jgi:hypothetical protein